ncbi:hypothetical protein JMJ77_0012462 [Colletotrichum scovillei]|uniref:Uncharacterized protein n=1 Tax=Colletotrichum scovillei TaxID=1209932 RepID=A0A9P7QX31_9PEZI|nr:hypothetical protein JMJ78_0001524 [Colletotrichum scovillei]KAG7041946.1 hypothetical protein JMJ77_0012462 [Colletotrichum scovillei]KAG7061979.1 hypothetical protein JMJ76_0003933 [Colletotrichum scovillei]
MDPLSALRATYYIVLFGIELDQVPQEVRNSLELVRTCHTDLQYLIEIRNELLPLLQRRSKVLERVNSIVETTHKGLVEVCELVEKSRPRLNNGRTPFRSRLSWILLDSAQFKAQRPVISRHHASVLAELNFLRQIALLAPTPDRGDGDDDASKKPTMLFDNVALLEDLIGKANTSGSVTSLPAYSSDINPPEQCQPADSIISQALFALSSGPCNVYPALSPPSISTDCPKLPSDFLFSSLSKIDIPEHLLDQNQDAPSILEYEETGDEVLDSSDGDGISLLFGDYANMTPLLTSTPSVSSASTSMSPWSTGAQHLHRPASVVSSLSSLRETPGLSNSETTSGVRFTSAMSSENLAQKQRTSSFCKQHQSEEFDHRNLDSPPVPGMIQDSTSPRSTSSPSLVSTPITSSARQFRSWSSPSFSLLGRHRRKDSHQSNPPDASPSPNVAKDPKVVYPGFVPLDVKYGQNAMSNGRFRAYSPIYRNEDVTSHLNSPPQPRLLQDQAFMTDFTHEQQLLRSPTHLACVAQERAPHPLSQATSLSSLRGSHISQSQDNVVPPQESEQVQVFEMLGSIPSLHQLASYQHPNNQRDFIDEPSFMANRDKEGRSSVPSDLGVFELP